MSAHSPITHNGTPTEDLIIEVLIARKRLGENIWNFDSRLKRQLDRLAGSGVLRHKSGHVENTRLAWLTDRYWSEYLAATSYTPPAQPTCSATAHDVRCALPADHHPGQHYYTNGKTTWTWAT